jgi:hypothetical protein
LFTRKSIKYISIFKGSKIHSGATASNGQNERNEKNEENERNEENGFAVPFQGAGLAVTRCIRLLP